MTFGENLVNLRKSKGVSQERLAERLGLTRQTISKWELNQSTPDLNYIIQMSEYFEVSIDYLVKGETTVVDEIQTQPIEIESVKKQNAITGYKWIFVLGLVLMAVSMFGIMIFAVCAAINPHTYEINGIEYRGLAGFLRGNESQGFFFALNSLFVFGLGFAGWGIFKQMCSDKGLLKKSNVEKN